MTTTQDIPTIESTAQLAEFMQGVMRLHEEQLTEELTTILDNVQFLPSEERATVFLRELRAAGYEVLPSDTDHDDFEG